jgi:hypothetical protein
MYTLAAGVVRNREAFSKFRLSQTCLQSTLYLTNPDFIRPFRVASTLSFYHNIGREKRVNSHVHPRECEGVSIANAVKIWTGITMSLVQRRLRLMLALFSYLGENFLCTVILLFIFDNYYSIID